ncbi:MAG: beta-lactamase family protein [Acidobacteriota bacterium]|nr:beta-lactamase family protein [Acidobacteriota bacterium]
MFTNRSLGTVAVAFLLTGLASSATDQNTQATKRTINRIFVDVMGQGVPGAAVLVRRNGHTVFQHGYGVRDLKIRAAIDTQTNFRLASCTKQFTAMAIMLLVHDGKLRYDERLTDVFPDFPAYGNQITIRNLLNHTSGLPDYEDLMDQVSAGNAPRWTEARQIQDDEVLALLKKQNSGKFIPGTQWSYSNSGYVTLGLIVAKVSHTRFDEFLHERIFHPLKMDHTLAYMRDENEVPKRAYGHTKVDKAFGQTDQSSTSATLGDGGVYSNLEDLARWDDALTHHKLLSEAEMRTALEPVKLSDKSHPRWASGPGDSDPQAGKPVSYGFGWFLDSYQGHPRMWHYGDTVGFKTAIERFTKDNLTVIVLCNRSDLDAGAIALKVANASFGASK